MNLGSAMRQEERFKFRVGLFGLRRNELQREVVFARDHVNIAANSLWLVSWDFEGNGLAKLTNVLIVRFQFFEFLRL